MGKGGHAHSGPPPTEGSRTSERKGYSLSALPFDGYDGEAPDLTAYMPDATSRHESIWAELWATPQAWAWSMERYRWPVVADLVKWMVRSDDPEAAASTATSVRQLRDDLGLSSAGLRSNGWKIADPPKESAGDEPAPSNVTDIKGRLNRGSA